MTMKIQFPEATACDTSPCRTSRTALKVFADFAAKGRIVFFDTETTGMTRFDQIIEIAAVEYVCGERTRTFRRYLLPTCEINPKAEAVHHISMAFLKEHGQSPKDVLDEFFAFLGQDVLLAAHNLEFDMGMLKNECLAFGYSTELCEVSFCDTIVLARHLVPGLPHYRLSCLIEEFGLAGANSHEAVSDADACAALFFKLIRRFQVPSDTGGTRSVASESTGN